MNKPVQSEVTKSRKAFADEVSGDEVILSRTIGAAAPSKLKQSDLQRVAKGTGSDSPYAEEVPDNERNATRTIPATTSSGLKQPDSDSYYDRPSSRIRKTSMQRNPQKHGGSDSGSETQPPRPGLVVPAAAAAAAFDSRKGIALAPGWHGPIGPAGGAPAGTVAASQAGAAGAGRRHEHEPRQQTAAASTSLPGAVAVSGSDTVGYSEHGDSSLNQSPARASSANSNHDDDFDDDDGLLLQARPFDLDQHEDRIRQEARDQIVSSAVEAEIVPRDNNKRRRGMMLILLLLIVLMAVIGLVLGIVLPRAANSGNPTADLSEVQRRPSNDECANATALVPDAETGHVMVVASSDFATRNPIPAPPVCGNDVNRTGPGAWFSLLGTGSIARMDTCGGADFDSRISVYAGSCDSRLECVAGNDQFCGDLSAVTWFAQSNQLYYILVHGSETGSFTLQLNTTEDNDSCDFAIGPILTDGSAAVVGSKGPPDNTTGLCINTESVAGKDVSGIWYTTVATGDALIASLCASLVDEYSILATVFSGDCEALDCVVSNSGFLCDEGHRSIRVAWRTTSGNKYYILLSNRGIFSGEDEGSSFVLNVEEVVPPENDLCDDAVGPLLVDGSVTVSSTINATNDSGPRSRNFFDRIIPSVWYTVVGTGSEIIASTCGTNQTDFDASIYIFSGSCQDLQFVTFSNSPCASSRGSRLVWKSIQGEIYHLAIGSWFQTGTFGLTLEQFDSSAYNSRCMNPIGPLPTNGSLTAGSTDGVVMDDLVPSCGVEEFNGSPGLWYSVVGTGSGLAASTCNTVTDPQNFGFGFFTNIFVFTGDCEHLDCIATDGCDNGILCDQFIGDGPCDRDPTRVAWDSILGQQYLLFVHSDFSDSAESFGLTIEEFTAPSNSHCASAVFLDISIGDATGSTNFAFNEVVRICDGVPNTAPGVWYRVDGVHGSLLASTYDSDYDTAITVYTGSCDRLECVAANDDGPSSLGNSGQSYITWDPVFGAQYYIRVHGRSHEDVGSFRLSVLQFDT